MNRKLDKVSSVVELVPADEKKKWRSLSLKEQEWAMEVAGKMEQCPTCGERRDSTR